MQPESVLIYFTGTEIEYMYIEWHKPHHSENIIEGYININMQASVALSLACSFGNLVLCLKAL